MSMNPTTREQNVVGKKSMLDIPFQQGGSTFDPTTGIMYGVSVLDDESYLGVWDTTNGEGKCVTS